MKEILKVLSVVICAQIWCVAGFLLWLPLLIKAAFCYLIIRVLNQPSSSEVLQAKGQLNFAWSFFNIGFDHILKFFGIVEVMNIDVTGSETDKGQFQASASHLAFDACLSIVFWFAVLRLVY